MNLPSITPEVIQKRMSVCWADANLCYRTELFTMSKMYLAEYDYLSNYMTWELVDRVLESCK